MGAVPLLSILFVEDDTDDDVELGECCNKYWWVEGVRGKMA